MNHITNHSINYTINHIMNGTYMIYGVSNTTIHVLISPYHTVDGCEILHHLGWLKPKQNNGMFTTYQLVQEFATIQSIIGHQEMVNTSFLLDA